MGTWGTGPLDNDDAADWCADLEDADAEDRIAMVREALLAVTEEDDYVDADTACEAVAAAAVVASQLPGGHRIRSSHAPDFLRRGEGMPLSDDLPSLALRALDRVEHDDSEWRQLWEEGSNLPKALAVLADLRAALAG